VNNGLKMMSINKRLLFFFILKIPLPDSKAAKRDLLKRLSFLFLNLEKFVGNLNIGDLSNIFQSPPVSGGCAINFLAR
jgi:hypothetical protein